MSSGSLIVQVYDKKVYKRQLTDEFSSLLRAKNSSILVQIMSIVFDKIIDFILSGTIYE